MLIRSGEAPGIGWSRNMLYSGFNALPRSVIRRQTKFAARITRTLSCLNKMTHIYSTNKVILKISIRDAFWEIRNASFPNAPAANEEIMRNNIGYYLADRVTGMGVQLPYREMTIDAVAPMIFRQELAEAGVDESLWPDTNDVKLFRKFFEIEQLPLIADFGEEPVINVQA